MIFKLFDPMYIVFELKTTQKQTHQTNHFVLTCSKEYDPTMLKQIKNKSVPG